MLMLLLPGFFLDVRLNISLAHGDCHVPLGINIGHRLEHGTCKHRTWAWGDMTQIHDQASPASSSRHVGQKTFLNISTSYLIHGILFLFSPFCSLQSLLLDLLSLGELVFDGEEGSVLSPQTFLLQSAALPSARRLAARIRRKTHLKEKSKGN